MIELPAGWRWSTVAEVGAVDLGRQRHPDWHEGPEMRPYLRVANVFENRIDTTDVKEMDFSGVFDRFKLEPGDVLLNEGQTPELLGRPAIYRGNPPDVAFTNTLLRFRAGPEVLPEWALIVFRHHMHVGRFTQESRITTNIAHLSAGRFKTVEFPVPPLSEQKKIIKLADEQLSRLNSAQSSLAAASLRLAAWKKATIQQKIWECDFPVRTVGELLAQPMRNGHSAKAKLGGEQGIRTLTLTAVTRNSFIDKFTKQTVADPNRVTDLWLHPGDILVQRANTPELVGTTALYEGPKDWAIFPDLLIRLRVNDSIVTSKYLAAALASERAHQQLRAKAKGLAGSMPKIDQNAIASTRVPVPDIETQYEITDLLDEVADRYARFRQAISCGRDRILVLQKCVIATAYIGKLAERPSGVELVKESAGV